MGGYGGATPPAGQGEHVALEIDNQVLIQPILSPIGSSAIGILVDLQVSKVDLLGEGGTGPVLEKPTTNT